MKSLAILIGALLAANALVAVGQNANFACPSEGFFVDPNDCSKFFRCVATHDMGRFLAYSFDCPSVLDFDESINVCNWPKDITNRVPCSRPASSRANDRTTGRGDSRYAYGESSDQLAANSRAIERQALQQRLIQQQQQLQANYAAQAQAAGQAPR